MAGLGMATGAPVAPNTAAPAPQAAPPQAAPQPGAMPQPGAAVGEQAASPEEQQLYDEIVSKAYTLIFDEKAGKVREPVLEHLKGDDPIEALAQTAAQVFGRVMQAAAEDGVQIPGDVKEAAGAEVFETMAEIASEAGIYDFMGDDKAFQAAFLRAADGLSNIERQNGSIDIEATKGEFAEMAAMDKDGRLDAILASLGEAA